MNIDDTDAAIIEALRRDARAPNVKIAQTVGVSEGTVRRRLNRLLAERLIEIRVAPIARQTSAGIGAIIEMTVRPDSLDLALEHALMFDETRFAVSVPAGVIIWVELEDVRALNDFLADSIRPIPGVERSETSIILDAAFRDRDEERREKREE